MRTSAASAPRRRRKSSVALESDDMDRFEEDGPRRIPLACGHCRSRKIKCSGEEGTCANCISSRSVCIYVRVTAEQNALAKAKKQTSRLTKGTKRSSSDSPIKREPAKRRPRVRSAPMSPATSHTGSLGSSSNSWAPSPLVEVPRRKSTGSSSPRSVSASYEHDARPLAPTDAAYGRPCCPPSAYPSTHSAHPYQYSRHGAAPASPVSPTWPEAQPWRAPYEGAAPQHGQWAPDRPESFPFPQPRHFQDQPGWMTPPDSADWQAPPPPPEQQHYAAYPPRPSMVHHPHSAPISTISSFPINTQRHMQQQPTPPFEFHSPEDSYISTFEAYQATQTTGRTDLIHFREDQTPSYPEYHPNVSFTAASDPAPALEEYMFDSAVSRQVSAFSPSPYEMERYEEQSQSGWYGVSSY